MCGAEVSGNVRNVLRVWRRDIVRLLKAPAALLVVVFLCVLPSLYTWFNVAGFWNPYENTGSLRVCVANEDEGAESELAGHLALGQAIEDALRENHQLDWQFVDRAQADEAVRSGSAYAALVIPRDFSANVASLATGDLVRPQIEYYVNEKIGPVAPKITDTGANTLDSMINETFVSTVSETVAGALKEALGESELALGQAKANALGRLTDARAKVDETRVALAGLSGSLRAARDSVGRAKDGLPGIRATIEGFADGIGTVSLLAGNANTLLVDFSTRASTTLDATSATVSGFSTKANSLIAQDTQAIAAAKGQADAALVRAEATQRELAGIVDLLQRARDVLPSPSGVSAVDQTLERARTANEALGAELKGLKALSADLDACATGLQDASRGVDSRVQLTVGAADSFRQLVRTTSVPTISSALAAIATSTSSLEASIARQDILSQQAIDAVDKLSDSLELASEAIGDTSKKLVSLEGDFDALITDVSALSVSDALSRVLDGKSVDASAVADFMMSPTQLQTEQLYPLNAYGSAMAPLFINLTLWIGVFMLMVIIRLEVDDEGIEGLSIAQRYFGRFLLLAPIACIQAAVCCTGCMVMGVQIASVVAFYATAIMASLAYLAIQFTLSTFFQHIGKAICVILVFVQIPGASGLYPIEMTPDFFRGVYALFPFTYGINAIRETIGGFYGSTWISCIGVLAGFLVAFALMGSLLRPLLANLNRMLAREIGESDMIVGESVDLPARRWPLSQVVRVLSNDSDYRRALESRVGWFAQHYRLLIQMSAFVGVAVPIVFTPVMLVLGVDKVIVLSAWLVWFLLIVTYVIVVEFVRDSLSHSASLELMADDEVRALLSNRDIFTRVQPLRADLAGMAAAPADARPAAQADARPTASASAPPAKRDDAGGADRPKNGGRP